jgi:hypothetical protein
VKELFSYIARYKPQVLPPVHHSSSCFRLLPPSLPLPFPPTVLILPFLISLPSISLFSFSCPYLSFFVSICLSFFLSLLRPHPAQTIELETKLKPFIPDYVPAIGYTHTRTHTQHTPTHTHTHTHTHTQNTRMLCRRMYPILRSMRKLAGGTEVHTCAYQTKGQVATLCVSACNREAKATGGGAIGGQFVGAGRRG